MVDTLHIIKTSLQEVIKAFENLVATYIKFVDNVVTNEIIEIGYNVSNNEFWLKANDKIEIQVYAINEFVQLYETYFEI